MKYSELINKLIQKRINENENIVIFGQNISAGSCLSGLTKNLSNRISSNRIINSTNSENSLCGFGFGLMINGVSSIFFMKQLDFLLLGIDHLVNTYNIIRSMYKNSSASFTIFPIIVDNGFQGPQSSLNNFGDFCSIANIDGYTITNKLDAEIIINELLISKGFRMIGVSQRMFNQDIIEPKKIISMNKSKSIFQYLDGEDVTIVCFNFSFPIGWEMSIKLKKSGFSISLFNVNSPISRDWNKIIENVKRTNKIIIIDDSKSKNLACDRLLVDIFQKCKVKKNIILRKKLNENWLVPNSDKMDVNIEEIIMKLRS